MILFRRCSEASTIRLLSHVCDREPEMISGVRFFCLSRSGFAHAALLIAESAGASFVGTTHGRRSIAPGWNSNTYMANSDSAVCNWVLRRMASWLLYLSPAIHGAANGAFNSEFSRILPVIP